jgi:hypothetical protein
MLKVFEQVKGKFWPLKYVPLKITYDFPEAKAEGKLA